MSDMRKKEIEGGEAEYIEAEFVTIRQSSVKSVEGGHVELQQVGSLSIDGERIEMTQSASGIVHCDEANLHQSMSLLTLGNRASLESSCSPVVMSGGDVGIKGSAVGIIGGKNLRAENSTAFLMIAKSVEGNPTVLLDWHSALALGAVIGGILGFASLVRK